MECDLFNFQTSEQVVPKVSRTNEVVAIKYCKLVRLYRRFPVRGGLVRPAPPPPRLRPRHVGVDGRGRRLLRHRLREARGYSGTDSMKPV